MAKRIISDEQALDEINEILSLCDRWDVGMLEDICETLRRTGREELDE